jgi:hypothetical protein
MEFYGDFVVRKVVSGERTYIVAFEFEDEEKAQDFALNAYYEQEKG